MKCKPQNEWSSEKLAEVNHRARTSNFSGFILIQSLLMIILTYSIWLIEDLDLDPRPGFWRSEVFQQRLDRNSFF